MRINVPFGLQAYDDRSLTVNSQRLINFFAEAQPKDSKAPFIVNPTPGSALWVTAGTGPIHGLKVFKNVLYGVSGQSLYSITTSGAVTLIGTITGNKRCSMEHNGDQLCIVNGTKGYIYDGATLQEITDPTFKDPTYGIPDRVVYLEGRFIFNRPGFNQFFCSDSYDGLSYDPLNFEYVRTSPENITSMIADHGEAWLFCKSGTEVWVYNRQESLFPFSRIDGSYVEKGCIATHTPAKIDNTFYWLGHDLCVYRADGYKPSRISTHAIEQHIKSYGDVSKAFGQTFVEQGHFFYEITFPDIATWRYDTSTGLWHQAREGISGRYHANAIEFFANNNLIGDYRNGNIYTLSREVFTDNLKTIYRVATTPHIHSGRIRAVMDRLDIDIKSGIGLTTGQGVDPQLMLRYSDDSGNTWSTQRWENMGRVGEYARRVRFSQLGMFYQRMFELTLSDPVDCVIVNAYADVDAEDSYA
jgi:hypothetical protein